MSELVCLCSPHDGSCLAATKLCVKGVAGKKNRLTQRGFYGKLQWRVLGLPVVSCCSHRPASERFTGFPGSRGLAGGTDFRWLLAAHPGEIIETPSMMR